MLLRKYFFVYILIAFLRPCLAQTYTLKYDLITESDGLSNHSIAQVVQDSEGYIWIGSGDGLNRFDGYSYKVYRKIQGDSTSMQRNYITSLAIDHSGILWISFSPNGLSSYDPLTDQFTNYYFNTNDPEGIRESPVNRIFIDSRDNIWLCCVRDGFYRFSRETKKLTGYGPLPGIHQEYTAAQKKIYNHVNRMYEDDKGLFWLATSDGLYTFNPADGALHSIRAKPVIPFKWRDDGFGPICFDGKERFWLGSWGGGLQSYNRNTGAWKMYKYHPENPESGTDNLVHDIKLKNDSELWLGTGSFGLAVFNMNQEKFYYLHNTTITNGNPNCWEIFIDKWSNKWLSLFGGLGFSAVNSDLFQYQMLDVTRTDNGDNYNATVVYKDARRQKLYIATSYADGLEVVDEVTHATRHYGFDVRKDEGDFLMVNDILKDSRGNLWVLTRDYLYLFDERLDKLVLAMQPPPDTAFKRIPFFEKLHEDAKHRLWISTLRHGVYLYDPEKKSFRLFLHDDKDSTSLCSDYVNDIAEDKLHRTWFSSAAKGISMYDDGCDCFKNLTQVDNDSTSLPSKIITGMVSNTAGDIWVSSYGGISYAQIENHKPITFRNYSYQNGLPSENINEIACDKRNNVWFSSPAGLSRLDIPTGVVSTFTDHEGLEKNYLDYTLTLADDGELFIGTTSGYFRFYPEKLVRKQTPPMVVINAVKVFDKNIPFREQLSRDKKINLTWKDNFFSFDFAALNFSSPEKNQFAYMLSGFDKDWIFCGNRRYAGYTNLNGGDYVFMVKASNGDGIWSSNLVSIPVHIELPYWKKPWFLIASVLFTSLLVYSMYMYRIKQISHTEKMKTDFNRQLAQVEMRALRAQMNPHFIFNCLNSINRYIVKSDSKTASLYLTKFSRLIRLILDNSENTNVLLSSEIELLRLYVEMESMRFENKFTYEFNASPPLLNEHIFIPPLIVQPYVENAIWHGLLNKESAGKLIVEVTRMNGSLQFIIQDNGVGRAKARDLKSKSATERKSLGIKLTEERIALLNGDASARSYVEIHDLFHESGESAGTRVVITIALEN